MRQNGESMRIKLLVDGILRANPSLTRAGNVRRWLS
jgi:hypothetical protein